MQILTIGNFTTGWDGSICDEEHIAGALEELGHNVARVQREGAYEDICKNWGNPVFDFVLIAQWDSYDERLWKMLPHPRVYWAFDYQVSGQMWHERLIRETDLYLSKRIADSKYPKWRWLSQDFAPSFLEPYPKKLNWNHIPDPVEKDIDVLFTGSYLDWATERNETLKAVDDNFNLQIYSVNAWPGFKHVNPPIMDHGLPELYARAKVILSIDHTLEAGYHSDRVAQALCCKGFVMHRYVPFDEVSFKDNVVYFYDQLDCLDKLQYYLNDEQQRREIAERGYIYADSNLRVKTRVKDLLIIVGQLLR